MRDCVGVKAESCYFSTCALVVFRGCCSGKEKLRFALGSVAFHRHNHRRADQDAILPGLGRDEGAFFDAIPFAQFGGDYNRSASSYFDRFHCSLPYISISEFQTFRHIAKSKSEKS
jgi:hypothetical protein